MNTVLSSSSRPWLSVAAVALGSFILITTEFLPIGFLERLGLAFHVQQGTVGLMVTIPGMVAAFAAPLATLLAGRVDRRLVLAISLVFVTLSNTVVALAATFTAALIGRALLGIAVGVFWSFCVAVARRLAPEEAGHRATAVVLAGVSVGTVVGVPVGSTLATIAGWRFAFGSAAVASFISLLVLSLLLPRIPGAQSTSLRAFASLFRIRPLLIGYATMGLSAAGHFAAYTYLQPLLLDHAKLGASGVSWTLFAYGVAGAAGTFLGERLTSIHLQRAFLFVVLALAAGVLLSSVVGSSVLTLSLVVLWGAAFGALPVCTQLWIYMAAPQQFEAASAMGMTVFQTALALGSLSGGIVFDRYGLTAAFGLGGSLLLICGVVIAALQGQIGQHPDSPDDPEPASS
jgi:predicted MFS family arabinose efflux permease